MAVIKVLPHPELCPRVSNSRRSPVFPLCTAPLDANIGIEHACDQSLACTTCHVIVREGFSKTGEMSEDEEDLLSIARGA